MQEVQVKLTIVNNFGKIGYIASPVCPLGHKLLDAVKDKVGYKAVEGKKERGSFAPEWIRLLQDSGYKLVVRELPQVKQYRIGEEFEPKQVITL